MVFFQYIELFLGTTSQNVFPSKAENVVRKVVCRNVNYCPNSNGAVCIVFLQKSWNLLTFFKHSQRGSRCLKTLLLKAASKISDWAIQYALYCEDSGSVRKLDTVCPADWLPSYHGNNLKQAIRNAVQLMVTVRGRSWVYWHGGGFWECHLLWKNM